MEQTRPMRPGTLLLALAALALLGACAARPASQYPAQARAPGSQTTASQLSNQSVANPVTEQREVRVGMSAADIAETLGSPNSVVTDALKRDTWTYDRIWTDAAYSATDSRGKLLMLDPPQGAAAAGAPQTAITVIVMFDEFGKVRDFAYHTPSP